MQPMKNSQFVLSEKGRRKIPSIIQYIFQEKVAVYPEKYKKIHTAGFALWCESIVIQIYIRFRQRF